MSVAIANSISSALVGTNPHGKWTVERTSYDRTRDELSIEVVSDGDPFVHVIRCERTDQEDALKRLTERLRLIDDDKKLHASLDEIVGMKVGSGWIIDGIRWSGISDRYAVTMTDGSSHLECRFGIEIVDPKQVVDRISRAVSAHVETEAAMVAEVRAEEERLTDALGRIQDSRLRAEISDMISRRVGTAVSSESASEREAM